MKLRKVVIRGFRSVPGTLTFHVRPTLTCLIGANEHGKSNVLEAIQRLESFGFDEFDRYSHSDDASEPTIQYQFAISVDEKNKLLDGLKRDIKRTEGEIAALASDPETKPDLLERKRNSLEWNQATLAAYQGSKDPQFVIEISGVGKGKLEFPRIVYTLEKKPKWESFLGSPLPQVRLFTASHELADIVTLEELNSRANLPFEGLLKLSGKWDGREQLFRGDIVAERRLVEAGKTLTRKLRGIWTQGSKHTFRLSESNGKLRVSIEDPTTLDTPSRRSLGFRSFLAFALTLYAETESLHPEGFILLFDEPGIHLHPQGQKDLLREIRRLSTRNQIIYTTHSPFMIDRNDLDATILVRKETVGRNKGTAFVYRPYGANWESLNAALGVGPSDAFFPPERSLLVEGSSDRAYLAKYMGLTASVTKADLNFLNIIDADRREEVEAVARILVSAGREIVVLADGDEGGKDWEKWLRRISGAKRDQLQFIDMRAISKSKKVVAVEDLLPSELWLSAVETWLREVRGVSHVIDRARVAQLAESQTIGRAMGDYLVEQGMLQWPKQFSKTNVADFFCRGEVPIPTRDEPILRLCGEITRRLGLVHQ